MPQFQSLIRTDICHIGGYRGTQRFIVHVMSCLEANMQLLIIVRNLYYMVSSLMVQESTFAVMDGDTQGQLSVHLILLTNLCGHKCSPGVMNCLCSLTLLRRSQPHAVFLLYIHGFVCKWTFLYADSELLLPFCNSLNHWTIT